VADFFTIYVIMIWFDG